MKQKLQVIIRPRARKDLGSPALLLFNTLVVFLVTQVIAAFIVSLILSIMHPGANASDLLNNSISGQFFYVLIAEFMAAGFVLNIVRRRGLSLSTIGLGRRPKLKDIGWALMGFVVLYFVLIIVSILVSNLLPGVNTNQQQNLGFTNITTTSDNILAFLALVILPPFGEEPLVRGYLFSGLRSRWRFIPAAIVTSLVFGLGHLEFGNGTPLVWVAGIETFFLSLILVYLRESTGALYAGILVHMLNNLVAFFISFH